MKQPTVELAAKLGEVIFFGCNPTGAVDLENEFHGDIITLAFVGQEPGHLRCVSASLLVTVGLPIVDRR